MTLPRQAMGADDIRSKYNNTGSTIGKRLVVKLDSDVDEILLPAATTDHIYGVTLEDIPDKTWGPIQIRGKAKVLSGAAMATPGVLTMANTSGKAIAFAAAGGVNANVLGTLEDTAGGADEVVEIELAGPGVIKQG